MSFLKRALKNSISKGINDAVSKAVKEAVEPAATNLANKAAMKMEDFAEKKMEEVEKQTELARANAKQAAAETGEAVAEAAARSQNVDMNQLKSAFASLAGMAQDYATEMSEKYKVCPGCGEPVDAEKKFCPNCGTKMPEQTLAEGAKCPNCGKQNDIGTKFCSDCGTKLPSAVAEDNAAKTKTESVMALWDEYMPHYTKWTQGGKDFYLENEGEYIRFMATFHTSFAAVNAVKQYTLALKEDGFVTAGQYPNEGQLYKMVDGVCYHVDLEHAFDGDSDTVSLYFNEQEPTGGFYYKKGDEKKKELEELKEGFNNLKSLFGK